MTTQVISFGYDGQQARGYVKLCTSGWYVWQVYGMEGQIGHGRERTEQEAAAACAGFGASVRYDKPE